MSTTPEFPVYVRIGDERMMFEATDEGRLQWFERPDIEEMPHDAWDSRGRQFLLAWDEPGRRVTLVFVSTNGLSAFGEAVKRHVDWYNENRRRRPAHHHADPKRLQEQFDGIRARTSGSPPGGDDGTKLNHPR